MLIMLEDPQVQLDALDEMMNLLDVSAESRPRYREGMAQLMELGWPSNYIDFGMINRYLLGLVPKYDGPWSYTDYLRLIQEEKVAKAKKVTEDVA